MDQSKVDISTEKFIAGQEKFYLHFFFYIFGPNDLFFALVLTDFIMIIF